MKSLGILGIMFALIAVGIYAIAAGWVTVSLNLGVQPNPTRNIELHQQADMQAVHLPSTNSSGATDSDVVREIESTSVAGAEQNAAPERNTKPSGATDSAVVRVNDSPLVAETEQLATETKQNATPEQSTTQPTPSTVDYASLNRSIMTVAEKLDRFNRKLAAQDRSQYQPTTVASNINPTPDHKEIQP